MPNPILENEIETVISNFDLDISAYEIIDMGQFKGWSSEYLYLLVASSGDYILKAKTVDQTDGYSNEVKVSEALLINNIPARRPILTKDGSIFLDQFGFHWCLMTYIPGAPSHVNEYKEITVKSLASHIDQYVLASTSKNDLMSLEFKQKPTLNGIDLLEHFVNEKEVLENLGVISNKDVCDLFNVIKEGHKKYLDDSKTKSLIHNDINPRNILIDHNSRNVISLIDWDHVCYGNPLKDVCDAVSIFYDFLPLDKAKNFKKLFTGSFTSTWFTKIANETLEYAQLFYYTVSKWRAILFYLDLLRKYDNKYGERARFLDEMKQNYTKWVGVINCISD